MIFKNHIYIFLIKAEGFFLIKNYFLFDYYLRKLSSYSFEIHEGHKQFCSTNKFYSRGDINIIDTFYTVKMMHFKAQV